MRYRRIVRWVVCGVAVFVSICTPTYANHTRPGSGNRPGRALIKGR